MRSRAVSPLWFSALLILGGALLTFGPSLLASGEALAVRPATCEAQRTEVLASQPEAAAALADSIWSNPDQATCILSAHSMGREDLLKVMEAIARDAEAAERYAKARKVGRTL